jgi:HSP90 family molecular chaperone
MPGTIAKEMTFDFDGLIQLLAGHLYSEKKVFIRELIQNAHDAIVRRVAADSSFERDQGHIDILTDLTASPSRIVFRDNGIGMTQLDLEVLLSTIGKSGTNEAREADEKLDVIGQFGIGFLSGFVVGGRVEVRTRHWHAPEDEGCLWENSGRADYTITPCTLQHIGTEVTIFLRSAEDRGLLHDDAVKKVIRDYADMLRVSIRLNDPGHQTPPINTRFMPWEKTGISEQEMRIDAMIYLERTVPDNVLEVIPIRIHEPTSKDMPAMQAEGLLYITRTRVFAVDAPRTVRVFLKRMFLCEGAKELLPPWATFINGILNTHSLTPNAARDNFTRDESYTRLRDRLGDLIVAHFEHLKENEPGRLSEILAYHDLGIKAACHYYDRFFEKFGHLLEWRVNAKTTAVSDSKRPASRRLLSEDVGANYSWATLPQVQSILPIPAGGGPKRLPCFTTRSSANQFFEMADAAGTTVVDASFPFEEELLRTWAEARRAEIQLVYVDREDDPAVFREIDVTQDQTVSQLAREMSAYIRPGGTGRLRVEARRFEPASLPAVLKSNDAATGSSKARSILSNPNSPSDLRAMAEEMLRLSRNADMRMSINAGNPLIRTLAALIEERREDPDLVDLMLGIYNDAILYNQELMTPHNAQIFHEQFQRLMGRSVEFVRQKAEIAREREALDRHRQAQRSKRDSPTKARAYLIAFLITPFSDEFKVTREAVRMAVEDKLGCEARLASDKTFEDFIRGNVKANMDDADFFVADVTGANPNVMMEIGAAYDGQPEKPLLLIARVATQGSKPELPSDLAGHITATYVLGNDAATVCSELEGHFLKNARLETLLNRSGRERFVSAEALRAWTRSVLAGADVYKRLSNLYPTVSAWRNAKLGEIERTLVGEVELAQAVLKRIMDNLPA